MHFSFLATSIFLIIKIEIGMSCSVDGDFILLIYNYQFYLKIRQQLRMLLQTFNDRL